MHCILYTIINNILSFWKYNFNCHLDFLSEYRSTNVLINILNTSENWKRNEINTWFSALAIQTQTNYLTFYYVLKLWDNALLKRFKSLMILMIWLKGKKPPFYCCCVKKTVLIYLFIACLNQYGKPLISIHNSVEIYANLYWKIYDKMRGAWE